MARRRERSFNDSSSDSSTGKPLKKMRKYQKEHFQEERQRRSYRDEFSDSELRQTKSNYAKRNEYEKRGKGYDGPPLRYAEQDNPERKQKDGSPTKKKDKYGGLEQRRSGKHDSPKERRNKRGSSSEENQNGNYSGLDRRRNEKYKSPDRRRSEKYESSDKRKNVKDDSLDRGRNEKYDDSERRCRNESLERRHERYSSDKRKDERCNSPEKRRNERYDSPKKRYEKDDSPQRRRNERNNSSDRKRSEKNVLQRRRKDKDNCLEKRNERGDSPERRNERDSSLERKRNKGDNSLERRRNKKDNSQERRNERDNSSERRNERNDSPERRRNERDSSPKRRKNERDNSQERRNERDSSPKRRKNERDNSPERRNERGNSRPERRRNESDKSPERRRNEHANSSGERAESHNSFNDKRKRRTEEQYSNLEKRRNERLKRSERENVRNSRERKETKKSKDHTKSKKLRNSEESTSSGESATASSSSGDEDKSSDSEERSKKHNDNVKNRKQVYDSPKRRMESSVNRIYDQWQDSHNKDSRDHNTPERDGAENLEYRRNRQVRLNTSTDNDEAPLESSQKEDALSKAKICNVKMRFGGAYIHPAKLKILQEQITDKSSIEYQRLAWEALKKSLIGLINKIDKSNIGYVVREIFKENVVRGRGVIARAIIQAQAQSSTFTHIYAALVAVINSKFPIQVGELLLKRLLIQFKRGFYRNNKQACLSSCRFIAHLINQQVAHEITALEILTLLLENPTNDSVEIAITMLKECGKKLTDVCPKGVTGIFDRLNHILQESHLSTRVHYMIEVMFAIRKDKFKDYEDIQEGLDLVEEGDKITHPLTLEDATDAEALLNVFRFDEEYQESEEKYKEIRQDLLAEGSDSDGSGSSSDESGSDDEEDDKAKETEQMVIQDMTETNLVALRRNIYLTIQSSLDFEECAHKLLKMELNPGQIVEMCYMILDCCAQQRTYEKFYGLLAQRFCQLNKIYVEPFTEIFKNSYETIHRLETNKLRNVAKFFAHLLYTDAISWLVLSNIRLNEDDTTSSNRIFIKILFQDLSEFMGLRKLFDRVKDVTLQEAFDGLFPRDNPRNTRFAINFFTSIGLGGLTDELREHLKTMPKNVPMKVLENPITVESSSERDSSSSASSSSSSSSSSESEENDAKRRRRRRQKEKQAKKQETESRNRQERKNRTPVQKHKKKRR